MRTLLLTLALAAAAPSASAQAPPTAKASPGGKAPAQAAAPAPPVAPTEKDLLAEFARAFKPSDAAARTAATTALGDGTRALPDAGASKLVARTLGKAWEDEDLEVMSAALAQLNYGRHVDTVLERFDEGLQALRSDIDARLTRPDEESKEYVKRGARVFGDGCAALANYRDDRAVESLCGLMRNLGRNTTPGNNLSTRVIGPLARALLSLGTHDAVETAIRQTQTYVGPGGKQDSSAKILHQALAEFATTFGVAPPEYSDNVSVEWNEWFSKVEDRLPKSLGRLKDPPSAPPAYEELDRRSMRDDGSAPRQ